MAQASDPVSRARAVLRRVLPRFARTSLRSLNDRVDPIRVARYRRRTGDDRPVPPPTLRERVGASSIHSYFATGKRYADAVESGLEAAGTSLEACRSVLDFGCGSAKVLQNLPARDVQEFFGADIHEPSIVWIRRHLPDLNVRVNAFNPPLPYEPGSFDCVYAWSVFSHLNAESQRLWLSELVRIVKPGGVLLISILGEESERAASRRAGGLDLDTVQERGFVFVPYAGTAPSYGDFAATDKEYGLAFVSRDHVTSRWSDFGEVVAILPLALDRVQDVVVLKPRPSPGSQKL